MDSIRKHMRLITRMAQSYVSRAMQGIDLSPSQMQGLRVVCFHDSISQQELADHLSIDKAAVARIITVLESKGYLTRAPDGQDGRVKRLTATASGRALKDAMIASETHFYQHIFSGLGPDDMAAFTRVLECAFRRAGAARQSGYALDGDTGHHHHPEREEAPPCS